VKAARPPAALALALLAALPGACKSGERPADRPAEKKEEAPPPPEDAAAMEVEREELSAEELPPPPPVPRAPRGLPPTPSPPHNPTTPARVELGRLLFFEPALSAGRAMACSTCHQPEHGWADPQPRSRVASGQPNLRHTPSLWNAAYQRDWGWDGGMPTLEAHILSHWKGQMGGQPDQVAAALGSSRGYAARFQRAFGAGGDPAAAEPSRERIAEALAAFVRTLRSGDSPWDQREAGVTGAVSGDAIAGARVFNERAGCATCHLPPLYSDRGYHDRGVDQSQLDPGRARITADARDQGAFRTPTLRGLVYTAPYFHDGSAGTLEAAVDHELVRSQVQLTAEERQQLLAFLRALSPEVRPAEAPELPRIP